MELTILMPCLNEAKTVASCVRKARLFLEQSGVSGEVLIADNGSADGSQRIASEAGARVVQASQKGYGAALIGGINAANGQYVIMGDSDDSYDFSELNGYLNELRSHADLVMGNRFRGHIEEGAMPFLHRYLGNPVLSWLGRLFFRTNIGDFHCGLRGFKKQSIIQLNLVTSGMEFASEMVAKAALAGLAIREVPTNLYRDGRGRPPHLRTWRDGWRHLLFMLLFSPRWLFVWPGIFLLCIGCSGLLTLTLSHATVAGVSLGIHSVLYSAASAIVGLQLIQLGVLTKWIGVVAGIVPRPTWLPVSHPLLSIESGLLFGSGLFIAGLLWSLQITLDWRVAGFGALEPTQVMPLVIPAVALMISGIQIAAGSLFTGALNFSLRSYRKSS